MTTTDDTSNQTHTDANVNIDLQRAAYEALGKAEADYDEAANAYNEYSLSGKVDKNKLEALRLAECKAGRIACEKTVALFEINKPELSKTARRLFKAWRKAALEMDEAAKLYNEKFSKYIEKAAAISAWLPDWIETEQCFFEAKNIRESAPFLPNIDHQHENQAAFRIDANERYVFEALARGPKGTAE